MTRLSYPRRVALTCATLLFAAPLCAQETPTPEASETLEPVTVTGLRIPAPADETGRFISVVTAEDIALRQQRFLTDAISLAPGIQPTRAGSFGGLSSVSIRGLPTDQTLVVVDGVEQNNPAFFGNSFDFANFDTSDIARIEVLRGAQSTVYGSDAIAGVINIVTADGREGLGGQALVEGGSFGTYRGSASLRGGNDAYSGRVTVSAVQTNGFSAADSANGNTETDGYENFTVGTKLRAAPLDGLELVSTARYSSSRTEFDGFPPPNFVLADADDTGATDELGLAATATLTSLGGALENRVRISYFENDLLNEGGGFVTFDANGRRASYAWQGTARPSERLAFVTGIELEEERSGVDTGLGSDLEADTFSYFILAEVKPLEFLTLNGGVRNDNNSDFGAETTFSVAAALAVPDTGLVLRGAWSEGFQAPTTGEQDFNSAQVAQFAFPPGTVLALRPETSRGWEIGADYSALGDRLLLQLTWFDNEVDDLLAFQFVPGAPNFGIFVNVQEFDTHGLELAARVRVSGTLDLTASYAYVDALNLTTGIAAGNLPDHRFSLDAAWRPLEKLTLSGTLTFNDNETSGVTTLDSFTLLSLRGAYDLTDHVELFARVENALDESYQDNAGFGTAPASAFGGVRVAF